MGLSIHYQGCFRPGASLRAMIVEVKDMATIYNWNYFIYDDDFPDASVGNTAYTQSIYGISFAPPKCEPVFLCFLSNGKMSSPDNLEFYGNSKIAEHENYLYMLSTKTQYAGIHTHVLIVHILKYLSEKYLQEFNVIDEGMYWETGDEKLLQNAFIRYNNAIEFFASPIENYPISAGEEFEIYFQRLLKYIHQEYKR